MRSGWVGKDLDGAVADAPQKDGRAYQHVGGLPGRVTGQRLAGESSTPDSCPGVIDRNG